MPVLVDVSSDGVRAPLSRERVRAIVRATLRSAGVKQALLSVTFVTAAAMARLNRRHLEHAGPTDVIAFSFAPITRRSPVVGDIYIAPEVARRNARAHGEGVRREVVRLVVHGTLHVIGHDHPDGADRTRSPMWRTQERLVQRLTAGAA